MFCNGACCFCSVPCNKVPELKQSETIPISNKEEYIGTYEVKKNLFGKEKVRKVKNENRTLGIEYSAQ